MKNLIKEYIEAVLKEYWGEPAGGVRRNSTTVSDPPKVPRSSSVPMPGSEPEDHGSEPNDLELEGESDLMLDKPGMIVEPDVRDKVKKYFRSMGLTPQHRPGKTFK